MRARDEVFQIAFPAEIVVGKEQNVRTTRRGHPAREMNRADGAQKARAVAVCCEPADPPEGKARRERAYEARLALRDRQHVVRGATALVLALEHRGIDGAGGSALFK